MSRRTERVNSLIRSELASLLLRDISDPALREITITDVALSSDLKQARVFYSRGHVQSAEVKPADVRKGFKRAVPFLKRHLAKTLSLRSVPELAFEEDTHTEELNRVMDLLENVKEEKALS